MRIGIPREIKVQEARVGMTPDGVGELVRRGHAVAVEAGAGQGSGYADADYQAAGATLVRDGEAAFAAADLIVKVKEPQPAECARLRPGQTIFTYLHLAADPAQATALMASGATCIAYETVTDPAGGLPLLRPMSEIAGRLSIQAGAWFLQRPNGGRGVLMGGAPGVEAANVVVLGGGVAGRQAALMAAGLRASVTVLDISPARLVQIDEAMGPAVRTLMSSAASIEAALGEADLVIGAVLTPGASAPRLVSRRMLSGMKRGAVLVDIAIDQGGCFETSRPTTHEAPVFEVDGILHYCVANMPGATPRTSTQALTAATLPFICALADKGAARALAEDSHFAAGLNVDAGRIVHPRVAEALAGRL